RLREVPARGHGSEISGRLSAQRREPRGDAEASRRHSRPRESVVGSRLADLASEQGGPGPPRRRRYGLAFAVRVLAGPRDGIRRPDERRRWPCVDLGRTVETVDRNLVTPRKLSLNTVCVLPRSLPRDAEVPG